MAQYSLKEINLLIDKRLVHYGLILPQDSESKDEYPEDFGFPRIVIDELIVK